VLDKVIISILLNADVAVPTTRAQFGEVYIHYWCKTQQVVSERANLNKLKKKINKAQAMFLEDAKKIEESESQIRHENEQQEVLEAARERIDEQITELRKLKETINFQNDESKVCCRIF